MAERYIEKFMATFFAEADYSRALKLAFLIINNDKNVDKETKEGFEWIAEHTTEKLDLPFYKAWNIVSLERNPKKIVSIIRGRGIRNVTDELTVQQIVVEVQKAHQKMYELMGKLAKKYDISVAIQSSSDDAFVMPVID
jgi:hypothetical protein